MRPSIVSLLTISGLAIGFSPPAAAQTIFEGRPDGRVFGPSPAVYAPLRAPIAPWSRYAEVRERQVVARQLAVLGWTSWQANYWALNGPDEWYFYPQPLTWAWDFPPVEQPVGYQRVYDGRGGYSSGPVYADQLAPRVVPLPVPAPAVPPMRPESPVEVGSRGPGPPRAAPAARTAENARRFLAW